MRRLEFELLATSPGTRARAGLVKTPRGSVPTPVFMPVGTLATVRGQDNANLKTAGSRILLANTYHLLIRPGPEVFTKLGGIHRFMNWDGLVLTDSGGFQIFSLDHARRMTEEGAEFRSYLDGNRLLLSPESSIAVQKAIGSDIMMVLDECIPSTADRPRAQAAMELTHRWAKRSLQARGDSTQALFAITQGACFHDLRRQSADHLTQMPFDGFAIGGLAVGEGKSEREDCTEIVADLLPKDRPRYLMGVGTPLDLLEAIHRGVDMFDCILPSSLAQQGVAYTSSGRLELRRGVYRFAEAKLDSDCVCETCKNFSRAYLHHLVKSKEMLGWRLIGLHNLTFYHRLMANARTAILNGSFESFLTQQRRALALSDPDHPKKHPNPVKRKTKNLELGNYKIERNSNGSFSILQISSGEVMHSINDPEQEAQSLYIEQARISERLREATPDPLIIWDVGLGAATNAMAAIRAFEDLSEKSEITRRPMTLISFEIDLAPLRLATRRQELFPHLHHAAPGQILAHGVWRHPHLPLEWKLLQGDFVTNISEAEVPDLIFFDPFSPKTDTALWQSHCFAQIEHHCQSKPMELYTYSASTAVRAAMLSAGLYVGLGRSTGPKASTTVAFNSKHRERNPILHAELLAQDWLARWERSEARFPTGIKESEKIAFDLRIREHPQFNR